jgi:hypothetical protein
MMRLPKFTYRQPTTIDEAIAIMSGEGPDTMSWPAAPISIPT